MYKWGISVVRSRNVQIIVHHGDVDKYEPALIPYFDSFRHTPILDEASWSYDAFENALMAHADKAVKSGEEVFITLGEKCNSELLDFYGFVIDDNSNDCVHVELELSSKDPMFSEKTIIYRARHTDNSDLKFMHNGMTAELLRAVRAITLTPEMLSDSMFMRGAPDESLGPLSEFLMADYFLSKIRVMYKGYPEEEDSISLEDPEVSIRRRLAIRMKRGEKKILTGLGSYYYHHMEVLAKELEEETLGHAHSEL